MWGFNAQQMMFSGLTAMELAEGGVPSRDIAFCRRYTVAECREAGCTAREMMAAARTIPQLIAAGYSARDFAQAGLTGGALKSIGFSDEDIAMAGELFMMPPPTASSSCRPSSSRPRTASRTANAPVGATAPPAAAPAVPPDSAPPSATSRRRGSGRPASAAPPRVPRACGSANAAARAGAAAVPSATKAAAPPRPHTAEPRTATADVALDEPIAPTSRLELALSTEGSSSLRPPARAA